MAIAAFADQQIIQWNVQWGMRNNMTGGTVGEFRPMWFNMALTTFGHNLFVIVFHRVVVMKFQVTVLAVKLVTLTVFLYFSKNTGMALGTLGNGQGLRGSDIHVRAAGRDIAISRNFGFFCSAYLHT